MSCEGRAWPNNRLGVSLCTHVFHKGFGRPRQRSRVKEARPLYFVSPKGGAKMRTDDKIVKLARSAKRSGIKLPFNVIADALDQDHRYMGVRIGSTYKRLVKRGQAKEAKDVADNICRADGRLAWPKMVVLIFLVQVVVGCSNRARIEGMLGERLGESLTANVQHKAEIARFTGTCDMVIVPENPFPGFLPGENGCRYDARIDRHKKVCLLSFYGEWEKDPKCDRDRARKIVANKIRLDITNVTFCKADA